MKLYGTWLVIVFGSALPLLAAQRPQPTTQSPSALNTVIENRIQLSTLQPGAKENKRIERAGNLSSRPWVEIAGPHPGVSQFPDAEHHRSKLVLFSLRF